MPPSARDTTARRPTGDDIKRLRRVKQFYRAKAVVLADWKRGSKPVFFELKGNEWEKLKNLRKVLG